jgi:hypothetical protein
MLPLRKVAVVPVSEVPIRHLFVVKVQQEAVLAIRARDNLRPEALATVLLPRGGVPPRYLWWQAQPMGLDLGTSATARVPEVPGAVTTEVRARRPGNLAIQGKSICLIAVHPEQDGDEVWVDLSSGKVVAVSSGHWYINNWELCFTDDEGEFHRLYGRSSVPPKEIRGQ